MLGLLRGLLTGLSLFWIILKLTQGLLSCNYITKFIVAICLYVIGYTGSASTLY